MLLTPYTTLRVGGPADIFYSVDSLDVLTEVAAHHAGEPITVLGGGSNVLISDAGIRGVVLHMKISGTSYEDVGAYIRVQVGAGVVWDEFVKDSIARGYCGLENLSGIPGTVGASPIQNIGAYGAEAKDTIEWVEVFDTRTLLVRRLNNTECAFGYRDSIFKKQKNLIVTRVAFLLPKEFTPNVGYKDLQSFFSKKNTQPKNAAAVRSAVLAVRRTKFPDLKHEQTAGSFFKNPIVSEAVAKAFIEKYPTLQVFPAGSGAVKVALGWILEHVCHVKGVRVKNVSMYAHHALVLCAHDDATARDVDAFARDIEKKVFDATGIGIEREVQTLA